MRLVLRGVKEEEPVQLWLEVIRDEVYVRARRGVGPEWSLVKFTENGICRIRNVGTDLGFPVEAVTHKIVVAE